MISKRAVILLAVVYLILAALVAFSGQILMAVLPADRQSNIPMYRGIGFAVLLAAAIGAGIVSYSQNLKKAKEAQKTAEQEALRQRGYVDALSQIALEMNLKRDHNMALDFICKELVAALGVNAATLTVYRPQSGMIELIADYGLPTDFRQNFRAVPFATHAVRLTSFSDPVIVNPDDKDLPDLPNSEMYRRYNFGRLAYLPLHNNDDLLGEVVVVSFRRDEEFTLDQLALMRAFGNQASLLLKNTRLLEDVTENKRKLEALRTGDLAILSSLDLNLTLKIFLQYVISELRADAADVLLLNAGTQQLEYAAGIGFQTGKIKEMHARLGEGHAGKVALERRSIYISDFNNPDDVSSIRRALIVAEGFCSYFGVPLVAKGHVSGVLEVFNRSPYYPTDQWLSFLETLAGQAAIAIDNASLFSNLQQSNLDLMIAYDRTLEGWSRALELRDRETEGHTLRVTEMSVKLGQVLNVNEDGLIQIRRGALLHDIGKMGIPDDILHKPGELTAEELEIVKKHPIIAFEMLSPISYLRPALDIPYCHHEKWDGSGYPRGLKGEAIPLSARIFAVVDVWDALTTDRPYRKAMPKEQAVQYIREQANKHFDPKVVDTFLGLIA